MKTESNVALTLTRKQAQTMLTEAAGNVATGANWVTEGADKDDQYRAWAFLKENLELVGTLVDQLRVKRVYRRRRGRKPNGDL